MVEAVEAALGLLRGRAGRRCRFLPIRRARTSCWAELLLQGAGPFCVVEHAWQICRALEWKGFEGKRKTC